MVFQPTITVTVRLDNLKRFSTLLHAGLRGPGVGIVDEMFNQWARRYSSFILERFDNASRGDGTWPRLAPATLYQRGRQPITRFYQHYKPLLKQGKITEKRFKSLLQKARERAAAIDTSTAAILWDTGTIRKALTIGATGNINKRQGPFQIFGIGGPAGHPGGGATIGRIAAYHNAGGTVPGRPPQRRILVQPLPAVIQGMRADAMRCARRLLTMGF